MVSVERALSGWGNCPVETCHLSRPDTIKRLAATITGDEERDYIARGLGRAYGDSSLNRESGVLDQTLFNRFIDFDESTGLLHCESGVSFETIIKVFLPRGWFLPVTPGTKYVTVGGAIAADVHGKNHHSDGTFGVFVDEITLMIGDGSIVTCSRESDPDLFWATIGGMGLTGVIISAKFRCRRVETAYYDVTYKRLANLDATLECIRDTSDQFRHSVAWVDCLASGKSLGRSVLMLANDTTLEQLPKRYQRDPLRVAGNLRAAVPFDLPNFTLNEWSVRAFNTAFYAKSSDGEHVEHYEKFWYPLDVMKGWNKIYGARGFIQYQALLPPESSREGFIKILERIAASRRASFLAVFKSCGPANPSPLSYLYPGHTLALDLPFTDDMPDLTKELDRMLLDHGGRLYLAKDAMMGPETFHAMYPRLDEFLAVKNRVDPNHRFVSSQARRVGMLTKR